MPEIQLNMLDGIPWSSMKASGDKAGTSRNAKYTIAIIRTSENMAVWPIVWCFITMQSSFYGLMAFWLEWPNGPLEKIPHSHRGVIF